MKWSWACVLDFARSQSEKFGKVSWELFRIISFIVLEGIVLNCYKYFSVLLKQDFTQLMPKCKQVLACLENESVLVSRYCLSVAVFKRTEIIFESIWGNCFKCKPFLFIRIKSVSGNSSDVHQQLVGPWMALLCMEFCFEVWLFKQIQPLLAVSVMHFVCRI